MCSAIIITKKIAIRISLKSFDPKLKQLYKQLFEKPVHPKYHQQYRGHGRALQAASRGEITPE
jgi:hypothetical protein